jgi:hypothetical protein
MSGLPARERVAVEFVPAGADRRSLECLSFRACCNRFLSCLHRKMIQDFDRVTEKTGKSAVFEVRMWRGKIFH